MRVSKRHQETSIKKTEVEIAIHEMREEKGLTGIEMLQALNSAAASILNYELRMERHGDYDTPAGLEVELKQVCYCQTRPAHEYSPRVRQCPPNGPWIPHILRDNNEL